MLPSVFVHWPSEKISNPGGVLVGGVYESRNPTIFSGWVLHVERAGWVAAVWSGDHFHDNHDHYPLDDVECVFELPTGSLCEHCNIPMAVCKLADPVILRCLSCGRYG